jgi:hypothetical protein
MFMALRVTTPLLDDNTEVAWSSSACATGAIATPFFKCITPIVGLPMLNVEAVIRCNSEEARVMSLVTPMPTVWATLLGWMRISPVPAFALPARLRSHAVTAITPLLLLTVLLSYTVRVPSPALS